MFQQTFASHRSAAAQPKWFKAAVYVSPDSLIDRTTNVPYYAVLVEADQASLATAGDLKLKAGMPAEVFLVGEKRTPLEYLIEPLTQVFRHAGRER